MNERLKQIRAHFGLSTRAFSDRIGMSSGAISLLETGQRSMTPQFIKLVSKEFGVNESWILTGEGDMLEPMTREQEIASITASIIKENNPIRIQLEKIVCNLTDEQLEHIYQIAKELVDAVEKSPSE